MPARALLLSLVVSLAGGKLTQLRPGMIWLGEIEQTGAIPGEAHSSPGMHPRHYSPRTRLYLVENGKVLTQGRSAYLQLSHAPAAAVTEVVGMPNDPAEYATRLYDALHVLDNKGFDWIAVDTPPNVPEWEAVLDRLSRAAFR